MDGLVELIRGLSERLINGPVASALNDLNGFDASNAFATAVYSIHKQLWATSTEVKYIMATHNVLGNDTHTSGSQAESECSPTGCALKRLGSSGEVLTRVDLDLAYSSEKLLNLDILLMHVEARAGDYEALFMDSEEVSAESIEKALEFDILSGILDSEVKELDNFMISLQEEIMDARERIYLCEHLKEIFTEVEGKLRDSEETLKKLQDQVSDMRMQSSKFQSTISFGGEDYWNSGVAEFPEISQFSSTGTKVKMQTADQQRHILKMLEKSLARELDLEKWLSESRHNEEELRLKLHYAEDMVDLSVERLFEAENTGEVLLGIAKEMAGKLQVVQLNLNGSLQREESTLQKLKASVAEISNLSSSLQEAKDRCTLANSENLVLREKVSSLGEQLIESNKCLQEGKLSTETSLDIQSKLESEISFLNNTIHELETNLSKEKRRAQSAEARCLELGEENSHQQLNLMEKVNLLEKQLRQSETQLHHAKASDEASRERQNMLASSFSDMENLVEDLKSKVLKAEMKAENAESKRIQLTEANLELNKEVACLRGRIECLEESLQKADDMKITTARDIGIKAKVITDLVMQLTLERERLRAQISSSAKENKSWLLKSKHGDYNISSAGKENGKESVPFKNDLAATQSSESLKEASESSRFLAEKFSENAFKCETEVRSAVSAEDSMVSKHEKVRKIEAGRLNSKYAFLAILAALASAVIVYLMQRENDPLDQPPY
ncbi:hypothetical protein ACLOJK_031084 [Asimina triloba]